MRSRFSFIFMRRSVLSNPPISGMSNSKSTTMVVRVPPDSGLNIHVPSYRSKSPSRCRNRQRCRASSQASSSIHRIRRPSTIPTHSVSTGTPSRRSRTVSRSRSDMNRGKSSTRFARAYAASSGARIRTVPSTCAIRQPPEWLGVQFQDIAVLEHVLPLHHLALKRTGPPDARVLEPVGKVLMHDRRRVLHGRPTLQDKGHRQVRAPSPGLRVDADDVEEPKYVQAQRVYIHPGFGRNGQDRPPARVKLAEDFQPPFRPRSVRLGRDEDR